MIPAFADPDPPEVSPYASQVEDYVQDFGRRIGLGETDEGRQRLRAGYGEFVAWTYPVASFEDLCVCAEWLFVTFVLDDLHTLSRYDSPQEWAPIHRQLRKVIESGQDVGRGTEFTRSVADVSRRTRERVSAAFYQRFAHHLDLFFTGFERESRDRLRGEIPAVADFTQTRRLSVGMEFAFDLVEFSHHIEVRDHVYASPIFQALITAACDVVAWQNDMHSVQLDIQRGDIHNLVLVLCHAPPGRPEQGPRPDRRQDHSKDRRLSRRGAGTARHSGPTGHTDRRVHADPADRRRDAAVDQRLPAVVPADQPLHHPGPHRPP
jgi:hypothetical protein